jgi:hypothetical protein
LSTIFVPIEALPRWLLDKNFRVPTILRLVFIPVTLILSSDTLSYEYTATPGLLAGLLGDLYYSNRSRTSSPTEAGLRIGVISAFDLFLGAASAIASGWAVSAGTAGIAAVLGVPWFLFSLLVLCLISVVGARVGGFLGGLPPFRRGVRQSN